MTAEPSGTSGRFTLNGLVQRALITLISGSVLLLPGGRRADSFQVLRPHFSFFSMQCYTSGFGYIWFILRKKCCKIFVFVSPDWCGAWFCMEFVCESVQ